MYRHWITNISNLNSAEAVAGKGMWGSVACWNELDEDFIIFNSIFCHFLLSVSVLLHGIKMPLY